MESKIKDVYSFIKNTENKKIKILFAIGIIAVLFIFLSSFGSSGTKQKNDASYNRIDYTEYVESLEGKLINIVSAIDGVGECRVMITLENSNESVYATDKENKTDESSVNTKDEYVLYDSDSGETPVLIKEYFPKIQGVSVVCAGADNSRVRENIIDTVASLFNISTNRISVSKIKS